MGKGSGLDLDLIADNASEMANEMIQRWNEDGARPFVWGKVFYLLPSGRFYSVWADNVDSDDLKKDSVFWEHFTEDLKAAGLSAKLGGPHGIMVIIEQG